MSCSSKRKRLVGSCINTLVSSTKSFWAVARRGVGPALTAGLTGLRATRVKGAGRVLRSTMSLLDSGGWDLRSGAGVEPLVAVPGGRTQALAGTAHRSTHPLW